MKIHADSRIDVDKILRSRGLGPSRAANRFLTGEVARMSDPYVPMEQGTLKNSVQVEDAAIIYPGPYAHYQYAGEVMAGRAPKHYTGQAIQYHGGPMRGKEWDKRMMADRGDEIADSLARYVGGTRK